MIHFYSTVVISTPFFLLSVPSVRPSVRAYRKTLVGFLLNGIYNDCLTNVSRDRIATMTYWTQEKGQGQIYITSGCIGCNDNSSYIIQTTL